MNIFTNFLDIIFGMIRLCSEESFLQEFISNNLPSEMQYSLCELYLTRSGFEWKGKSMAIIWNNKHPTDGNEIISGMKTYHDVIEIDGKKYKVGDKTSDEDPIVVWDTLCSADAVMVKFSKTDDAIIVIKLHAVKE